jgi:hypothetical protein
LLIVRVDVANPDVLLVKVTETGLAVIEKGTTLTETLAVVVTPPPTPLTVIE